MTKVTVKQELICRVCLSSQEETYLSLFEKYKCLRLFEYINIFSDVNIQESDGFPDKLCGKCFFLLERAIDFKQKCENSNAKLKSEYLKKSPYQIIKAEKLEKVSSENKLEDNYFEACIDECEPPQDELVDKVDLIHNLNDSLSKETLLRIQCHDCGEFFKSKCKLRVHWKKVHLPKSLICSRCKKNFKTYKAMHVHLKKNSAYCVILSNENVRTEGEGRLKIIHCKECGYSTNRILSMRTHLRIHSGERPFQCSECPKRFSQQSSLIAHREALHKKFLIEITCHICGKVKKGRSRMSKHLAIHKDNKKIKCELCKKPVFKKYLNDHMLRHTGIKSVTCEICAAAFYTVAELYTHRRKKHTKGEPIKCTKCDFKTSNSSVLEKHRSKHTDDNIPCTMCGKFFITVQRLAAHLKGHNGEKQYRCLICGKDFLYSYSLTRHKLLHHPLNLESKNLEK